MWLTPNPASSSSDGGAADGTTADGANSRVVVRLARVAYPSLAIPSESPESSSSTSSGSDSSDSESGSGTAGSSRSVAITAEAEAAAWAALWAHREAVPTNGDVQWSVRKSSDAYTTNGQGNKDGASGSGSTHSGTTGRTTSGGSGPIDSGVGRLVYVWTSEPLNSASPSPPATTPLLMLALPHHQDALLNSAASYATGNAATDTSSDSNNRSNGDLSSSNGSKTEAAPGVALACVKGYMAAHVGHTWTLEWHLPRLGSNYHRRPMSGSVFEATHALSEELAQATSSRFPYGDDGADLNAVDNVRSG